MDCVKCGKDLPESALFCPWCGKKQTVTPQKKYRKRTDGSGTVYRMRGRKLHPWVAQKNQILIGTFATRGEAEKALDRITDEDITDRYNLTFAEVYDRWSSAHFREITKSQQGAYRASFRAASDLHSHKFRSLHKADFMAEVIKRERAGMSQSTCEKMIQLFSAMGSWAEENGIVSRNPASKLRTVARQKSEGQCFSPEQVDAIRRSSHRAAPVVLLMLATGCRPGEVFTVRLSNCFDDYFVGGSKTVEGRNRVIPVASIGLDAYRSMRAAAQESGGELLIDGYEGNRKPENFSKRDFADLMRSLGIQGFTPVDCRHTYSTYLAKAGVPPQLIRRLMGHATVKTSDKYYTHLDLEDLRAGSDMLPL